MATQNFRRDGGSEPKIESVLKKKAEEMRRRRAALEEESLRRRRVVPGPVDTPQSADAAVALHKDFLNVVSAQPTGAVESVFTRDANRGLRVYVTPGSATSAGFFDDFWFGGTNGPWFGSFAGTGAFFTTSSFGVDPTEKCQGVWQMSTGTDVASGRAGMHLGVDGFLLGTAAWEWSGRYAVSVLSDTTNEYRVHVGFFDSPAASAMPVDAVCFMYRRTTEGNFWVCVSSSNSNADPTSPTNTTLTATSVAIVAGVFQDLRIAVNSAGTSASYYIDGVLVATHVANIPTGSGRNLTVAQRMYKTAGAGALARVLYVDYVGLLMTGGAR